MGPFEDVITLAVNAAMPMLTAADRDAIRLLIVATESAPDQEKPVSSWVHRFLGLRSDCRNFEVKHACYGATGALQVAIGWLMSAVDPGAKALIVNADHALIGLEGPQEPVLGAAGLACCSRNQPRIVEFDAGWNGVYAHEVADIFRPAPGVETGDADESLESYLDAVEFTYDAYVARASGTRSTSIGSSPPTCITCRSAVSPSAHKPDTCTLRREWRIASVGDCDLPDRRARWPLRDNILDQFVAAFPIAGCIGNGDDFSKIPDNRESLPSKGMLHLFRGWIPPRT